MVFYIYGFLHLIYLKTVKEVWLSLSEILKLVIYKITIPFKGILSFSFIYSPNICVSFLRLQILEISHKRKTNKLLI